MARSVDQSDEPVHDHLVAALDHLEDDEARYHVRQAMQMLAGDEDDR